MIPSTSPTKFSKEQGEYSTLVDEDLGVFLSYHTAYNSRLTLLSRAMPGDYYQGSQTTSAYARNSNKTKLHKRRAILKWGTIGLVVALAVMAAVAILSPDSRSSSSSLSANNNAGAQSQELLADTEPLSAFAGDGIVDIGAVQSVTDPTASETESDRCVYLEADWCSPS